MLRDAGGGRACAARGAITLLCARAGGGKTALLRRIAALDPWPQDMGAELDGRPWPWHRPPPVRFIPDLRPPLWLGTTIAEEIAFGLETMPPAETLVRELRAWGVRAAPEASPERLSAREAAGLQLAAAALAARAGAIEMLLLDQTLDALARAAARGLAHRLVALARETGLVVLLATVRPACFRGLAAGLWRLVGAGARTIAARRLS